MLRAYAKRTRKADVSAADVIAALTKGTQLGPTWVHWVTIVHFCSAQKATK